MLPGFDFIEAGVEYGVINITASARNLNLRALHDSIYGSPVPGGKVVVTVSPGVVIGSVSTGAYALTTGSWPGTTSLRLNLYGRIAGRGGDGGSASMGADNHYGNQGGGGGPALQVLCPLELAGTGGIDGGGGGGASGGSDYIGAFGPQANGGGGGGGAGDLPGNGGSGANWGGSGSLDSGGGGGGGSDNDHGGGAGGGPGSPGGSSTGQFVGPGGPAGYAIVGAGNISNVGFSGWVRGPTA